MKPNVILNKCIWMNPYPCIVSKCLIYIKFTLLEIRNTFICSLSKK